MISTCPDAGMDGASSHHWALVCATGIADISPQCEIIPLPGARGSSPLYLYLVTITKVISVVPLSPFVCPIITSYSCSLLSASWHRLPLNLDRIPVHTCCRLVSCDPRLLSPSCRDSIPTLVHPVSAARLTSRSLLTLSKVTQR